jgi:nucleoside phosphorylase
LDADGLTFACATPSEANVARRLGLAHAVIGLGGANGLPEGRLVSFGLAGALHDGIALGTVIDATRIVDEEGAVLWEGGPLGASGARPGTIVALDRIVDEPWERQRLRDRTGADAVDMESGVLARTGRLAGCLRAISDTPSRRIDALAGVVGTTGKLDWPAFLRAIGRNPPRATSAILDAIRALRSLEKAAA